MSLGIYQELYRLLHKKMSNSTKSVLALKSLVEEIQDAYKEFGTKLKSIASKFHNSISSELEDDPDEIVFIN